MVDRAALEMPCPLPGPGFESRTLRQKNTLPGGRVFLMRSYAAFRVIGQKVLMKTAVIVEKSTVIAVLSCFEQLTGWTKTVDKNTFKY